MGDREQRLDEAAQILVDECARRDGLSPEDAARAAWSPGDRGVEEIADLIRSQRREAGWSDAQIENGMAPH
jgi:hypothetical protein